MGITEQERRFLDELYRALCSKCEELTVALRREELEADAGFFNGHYHRASDGEWQMEHYPIPVISVKGLCDIEINLDGISVSTKKRRRDALECSFDKFRGYSFEAYGVEGYLDTFYRNGMTIDEMGENIRRCGEREIGFEFGFPSDAESAAVLRLIKLLIEEGFYY